MQFLPKRLKFEKKVLSLITFIENQKKLMTKLNELHILIAEDDLDDSEIIERSFSRHSAFSKISLVKNGKELLDFLNNEPEKPDVILTDINMPIINGIEALMKIANDEELKKIPSFAYSTSISKVYVSKCIQYGVRSFLAKPFVLEEFDEIPHKIYTIISESAIQ